MARQLLDLKPATFKTDSQILLSDFKKTINKEDIKKTVEYLASEKFKGRFTGSDEEKIYTEEISQLFKKWGLKPVIEKNFVQEFEFVSDVKAGDANSASLQGRFNKDLKIGQDYQLVSYSKTGDF